MSDIVITGSTDDIGRRAVHQLHTENYVVTGVTRSANGGSVDRDAVYAIGGYADDRMLRGFTRPTARITRDLQASGAVANGVESALIPIYRGGVKALGFRIPLEMVRLLQRTMIRQQQADCTEGHTDVRGLNGTDSGYRVANL